MDKIIVLVDSSDKTITICNKTVKTYDWNNYSTIYSILKNKNVYFITGEVVETKRR